jgi:hypothetical protein
MNESDITTWPALRDYCKDKHEPITREMDKMSSDIKKVDHRIWAIVIGIVMILATQLLALGVTLAMNGHIK